MSFVLSKIVWPLLTPSNLVMLAIVLGGLLTLGRWRRLGRALVGLGVAAVLLVALLPVGQWLAVPLEHRFPPAAELPDRVDGIIVLGGGVNRSRVSVPGGAQLNEAADRLAAMVILARRYPQARIVYSGGNATIGGGPREADAVAGLLAEMGLASPRIRYEREARTTRENAALTAAMMRPRPGETWLLVTSAMHMPRAMGVFRREGWHPLPVPVDFVTDGEISLLDTPGWPVARLVAVDAAAREWVGLMYYRLLGFTDAVFPGDGQAGGGA